MSSYAKNSNRVSTAKPTTTTYEYQEKAVTHTETIKKKFHDEGVVKKKRNYTFFQSVDGTQKEKKVITEKIPKQVKVEIVPPQIIDNYQYKETKVLRNKDPKKESYVYHNRKCTPLVLDGYEKRYVNGRVEQKRIPFQGGNQRSYQNIKNASSSASRTQISKRSNFVRNKSEPKIQTVKKVIYSSSSKGGLKNIPKGKGGQTGQTGQTYKYYESKYERRNGSKSKSPSQNQGSYYKKEVVSYKKH